MIWVLYILTVGILRLLFHWKPQWMLKCTHVPCPLPQATKVMLIDHYNQTFVEDVHSVHSNQIKRNCSPGYSTFKENSLVDGDHVQVNGTSANGEPPVKEKENFMPTIELLKPDGKGKFDVVDHLVFFVNKKVKYIWDEQLNRFTRVTGLDSCIPCSYFYSHNGLSPQDQENR